MLPEARIGGAVDAQDQRQLAAHHRRHRAAGHAVQRIVAPTLVLWGDRDRLVARVVIDALALRRPDWDTTVLADVGHCPQMEQPQHYLEAVTEWLQRPAAASPLPARSTA